MTTSRKSQSQDLLVSVAESIGATLGAIAAKADAAQKAIVSGTDGATKEVRRQATKLVRRGKKGVAKVRGSARKVRGSARSSGSAARKTARRVVRRAQGTVRKAKRAGKPVAKRRARR